MRVRVVYGSIDELPQDRIQSLQNLDRLRRIRYNAGDVPTGTELIVYGIEFSEGWVLYNLGDHPHDSYVVTCLGALFDIVDSRPSKYWECRAFEDGTFVLWPPSWFSECYHDRLSDGDPALVKDWEEIKRLFAEEQSL